MLEQVPEGAGPTSAAAGPAAGPRIIALVEVGGLLAVLLWQRWLTAVLPEPILGILRER